MIIVHCAQEAEKRHMVLHWASTRLRDIGLSVPISVSTFITWAQNLLCCLLLEAGRGRVFILAHRKSCMILKDCQFKLVAFGKNGLL